MRAAGVAAAAGICVLAATAPPLGAQVFDSATAAARTRVWCGLRPGHAWWWLS